MSMYTKMSRGGGGDIVRIPVISITANTQLRQSYLLSKPDW